MTKNGVRNSATYSHTCLTGEKNHIDKRRGLLITMNSNYSGVAYETTIITNLGK
jgi:hypothetical protein